MHYESGGKGVVVRRADSGWTWGRRMPAGGRAAGPACLYFPLRSGEAARYWARRVAAELGWRAWVRQAKRTGGPWEIKVALPPRVDAQEGRLALRALAAGDGAAVQRWRWSLWARSAGEPA
jgi:hypothetical protein